MNSKTPAGTIRIDNLNIYAHHGVLPQERKVGNNFTVSMRLHFDATKAMESDDLDATINYADLVQIIKDEMAVPSKLLEHVVYRLHSHITGRYPEITGGAISLYKNNPPIPCQVERIGFTYEW